jgi:hypothetical protein
MAKRSRNAVPVSIGDTNMKVTVHVSLFISGIADLEVGEEGVAVQLAMEPKIEMGAMAVVPQGGTDLTHEESNLVATIGANRMVNFAQTKIAAKLEESGFTNEPRGILSMMKTKGEA